MLYIIYIFFNMLRPLYNDFVSFTHDISWVYISFS